jgi:hypothetical protein
VAQSSGNRQWKSPACHHQLAPSLRNKYIHDYTNIFIQKKKNPTIESVCIICVDKD